MLVRGFLRRSCYSSYTWNRAQPRAFASKSNSNPSTKFVVVANIMAGSMLMGTAIGLSILYFESTKRGGGPLTRNILLLQCLGAVGLVTVGRTTWRTVKNYTQYIHYGLNCRAPSLPTRYGTNSWAVVTGGTGGIGKEFVHYLARQNINVIFTDKDNDGLTLQEECQSLYPDVKVEFLNFDLNKITSPASLQQFMGHFDDKDVSLLFHVAGVGRMDIPFHSSPPQELIEMCNINMLPSVLLTHQFLPKLIQRTKDGDVHSGCFYVGGAAGEFTVPFGTYGATKSFLISFARYMELAYSDEKIDWCVSCPLTIKTPMTLLLNPETTADGLVNISPEQFVKTSMKQFGRYSKTNGWFFHAVQSYTFRNVVPPKKLFSLMEEEFSPKLEALKRSSPSERNLQ